MNNISKTTLGEVADFIGGSQPAKKYFSYSEKEGFIRLIQIRDYKTDNFITYIPKDSTRKFCSKEDIMIGRYGPPIFQILRGIEGADNVAVMKAIPKENIINDYLYYFLCQEKLFEYINGLSPRTGGQTGVDVVMLKKYPILLPEIEEQKQIGKALSDLDAKIEVNNKINQKLEAMAKTLYDYWFVQFDFPDTNGKPYKSSGGKMVFNPKLKREIPEGWEVKDLEDVESNIVTGKTPSTKKDEFYNGEIPFITIGDIRGNMHITETEQTLSELGGNQNPNKFLPKGSVCVTCIASPGLVGFVTKDSQTNQQINSIIFKNQEIRYYLYFYLKDYFKFAKASSGSTFSNMNKGDFSAIKTIKPNKEMLINFSNRLEASINKILINQLANQKLSELRDWLLPMLMNGQVTVGEVEQKLGMVAE
jgi:type I restriction enzyme S subunit